MEKKLVMVVSSKFLLEERAEFGESARGATGPDGRLNHQEKFGSQTRRARERKYFRRPKKDVSLTQP